MSERKRTLDPDQMQYLIDLKKIPNEDDVRYKEIIKQQLLNDNILIWLLNNKELEDAGADNDEYFGVNIRPEFIIPETQVDIRNFICFEISYNEDSRYNPDIKYLQIIFYILCHEKDGIVPEIGAARKDLISAVIIDKFNGSNMFGNQLKIVSDKPSVTDSKYSTRTLIFEQKTTNSLTNKDGRVFNLRR